MQRKNSKRPIKLMKIEHQPKYILTLLSIWGFSQPWGSFFFNCCKDAFASQNSSSRRIRPLPASRSAWQEVLGFTSGPAGRHAHMSDKRTTCSNAHHFRDLCSRARYQGLFPTKSSLPLTWRKKKDASFFLREIFAPLLACHDYSVIT